MIICAVVVVEGRDREHEPRTERADPRKSNKGVVLAVGVAEELTLRAGVVWVEGHLIEITPQLREQAQLVL